ncbi:hypothetical protein ER308_04440 [Egibacter rhizosphaerae]|uniref:Uncharacterized protein n=1 Tax=Egibacter rhizosphaerae TaxID=1670831 RepID=A0A411YCG7_9ACTN|nr:hypothetical protein [Egibacter rhizosphaerae]QBI18865.1 hypothetical protein ER308_04440 [Egibacter rhizosphaerae]
MDRYRAADRAELAVRRALTHADVVEIEDRLAVVAELVARLQRQQDRDAVDALRYGASCAHVARLLGLSRQAVRQRLLPRAQHDPAPLSGRRGL